MLSQRLKQYRYPYTKLVPRSPEVRSVCGTHIFSCLDPDIELLQSEYRLLIMSGKTRYSFSRWLMIDKHVTPVETGNICKRATEKKDVEIVISDRFNDILRLADTHHFTSCLKAGKVGDTVPLKLLRDPDTAVMYIPDKAGKFKGRCVFKAGTLYTVFRCYGTMSFEIASKLLTSLGKNVNPIIDDVVSAYNTI